MESEDGLTEGAEARATASASAVIAPTVDACERGAEMIAEMIDAHAAAVATTGEELSVPPVAHRARWAKEAYLVNCLHAPSDVPFANFQPSRRWSRRWATARGGAPREHRGRGGETGALARGRAEVRELVSLYQGKWRRPGGDESRSRVGAPSWAARSTRSWTPMGATTEPVPAFDEVQNPRARAEIRREFAGKIIERTRSCTPP